MDTSSITEQTSGDEGKQWRKERKRRHENEVERGKDPERNKDDRRDQSSNRHNSRERNRDKNEKDHHRTPRHHKSSEEKGSHHRDKGVGERYRERNKEEKDYGRHRHKRFRSHNLDGERGEKSYSSRRHRHESHHSKSTEDKVSKDVIGSPEGQWVEKWVEVPKLRSESPIPENMVAKKSTSKRDAWMVQSEQDAFEFTHSSATKQAGTTHIATTKPDYTPIIHKKELNTQFREGKVIDEYTAEDTPTYTFGDSGSNWRMMKLKRVYEIAEETGESAEKVALERFGSLKSFDEAREERQELDRRQVYGKDRLDAKDKPTGELYAARLKEVTEREKERQANQPSLLQGQKVPDGPHTTTTTSLDQTALNRMQAALLKAQLRKDPKAVEMETEYNAALAQFANQKEPEVIVLSAMDSRMLAHSIGGRGEVKVVTEGKRKGQLQDNDEMTIEDMLREEKRTRGQVHGGEGRMFAERIAKDSKFDDNLDYMDENADRLAKRIHKNDISLKNIAISDYKKMQRVLETCPLCSHEDRNAPPVAPVVSLGTRVFLTLPTLPELSDGGAIIVPIQHRTNTLECDDDEWEEIRNFMKSLIRMYHHQGRGVIFYENAAVPTRRKHAAISAIPMPLDITAEAPAYFREAILSSASEWSQHKKLVSTLNSQLGKRAFRSTFVKEMPYFHVWFQIDGGLGHIVEDENKWPKGDLFAREVIGGMLDLDKFSVVNKQGRWTRGGDAQRLERFRKNWHTWDWTKILLDGVAEGV